MALQHLPDRIHGTDRVIERQHAAAEADPRAAHVDARHATVKGESDAIRGDSRCLGGPIRPQDGHILRVDVGRSFRFTRSDGPGVPCRLPLRELLSHLARRPKHGHFPATGDDTRTAHPFDPHLVHVHRDGVCAVQSHSDVEEPNGKPPDPNLADRHVEVRSLGGHRDTRANHRAHGQRRNTPREEHAHYERAVPESATHARTA
jgi:hypothetical protein